ncbi:MAG: Trm112 family protein [Hyphomicrobium sp.]
MSETEQSQSSDSTSTERKIDRKLLEILVCPLTKGPLIYDEQHQELISKTAGLAYPIRNGVPLMTRESARQLEDKDFKKR